MNSSLGIFCTCLLFCLFQTTSSLSCYACWNSCGARFSASLPQFKVFNNCTVCGSRLTYVYDQPYSLVKYCIPSCSEGVEFATDGVKAVTKCCNTDNCNTDELHSDASIIRLQKTYVLWFVTLIVCALANL